MLLEIRFIMRLNIILYLTVFILPFLITSCDSKVKSNPCFEKLWYRVGDVIDINQISKDKFMHGSLLMFNKGLSGEIGFGRNDLDTTFTKGTHLHWDENNSLVEIYYSHINLESKSYDKFLYYAHNSYLKYFGCIPGFNAFLIEGGTMIYGDLQFELREGAIVYSLIVSRINSDNLSP